MIEAQKNSALCISAKKTIACLAALAKELQVDFLKYKRSACCGKKTHPARGRAA